MKRLATTTKAITKPVIDPVCGMIVDPGRTRLVALYQGHSYWFCAEGCRRAFETNPKKHLEPKQPSLRAGGDVIWSGWPRQTRNSSVTAVPNATEQ